MNLDNPRKKNPRFLVTRTVTFRDKDAWPGPTDLFDELGYIEDRVKVFPNFLTSVAYKWCEFQYAIRLLFLCRDYEGIAVGRYGVWFPILQKLLGMQKCVVMTDTEWQELSGGRLHRAAALASSAVCSNTRIEIDRYARQYGIPPSRFAFVPTAFPSEDICKATDEGYVFSGGIQGRDWRTLVAAVEAQAFDVRVFTSNKLSYVPANITVVKHVSRNEYFRQMAASSCVVVPLVSEPLRVTGIATWTAAMAMGKVVIVTEPEGARDFMEHGVSGFYVEHGDAKALRHCLQLVMENTDLRKRVGEAARERASKEFSPNVFRQRVLSLLQAGTTPI